MSNKQKHNENSIATSSRERLGTVGGQAVMEGVMMMKKTDGVVAVAVRRANGEIVKKTKDYKALSEKLKVSKIPIIRGFINFIDMMKLAMGTLTESMEMLELLEDEESGKPVEEKTDDDKKENKNKEAEKGDSSKMIAAASVIGIVLGLGLSFVLFFFLPTFLGGQIESAFIYNWEVALSPALLSMFEGILRLAIFLGYILLVSQLKDIRRTFEYHGAEHKSIFAYEQGEELTVENVRKYSRFHPRCGTSFLIIMILIGFVVGMIIPRDLWFRVLIRLALFPLVIGFAYEFIKLAGKHSENILVKIISAPGMWVQRLTTKNPDEGQLEVAIASLKLALKLEEPDEIKPDEILNEEHNITETERLGN